MGRTPARMMDTTWLSMNPGSASTAAAVWASWIISSADMENDTTTVSSITPITGNNDAIVTIPNPDRDDYPLPAAAAMPMPSANTSGTVTGPVVTAPVSQARPRTFESSGSNIRYPTNRRMGTKVR